MCLNVSPVVTLVGSTGTSLLEWVCLNVSPLVTLDGSTGTSLFEWVCLNVSPLVTSVGSTGTSLLEWVCLNVSPLVTLVGDQMTVVRPSGYFLYVLFTVYPCLNDPLLLLKLMLKVRFRSFSCSIKLKYSD